MMLWKYVFMSLCMVHFSVAKICPDTEDLAPSCTCTAFDRIALMTCFHIMSSEELIPPITAAEGYDMLSISIDNSSILYVPSDAFKGTKFAKISFKNSQVMSLSDGDLAFKGLENYLEELQAIGARYIATWDWNQLRNHKKLNLIDVHKMSMHSVDNKFPHIPSLKAVGITMAEISFIHPHAFQELENLELLILKDNEIKEMSRSMLPMPAVKLAVLDLSDNQLKSLPHDMFTKMPKLKEVVLSRNKFTTLNEETFSGIFNSLQLLMLNGNKFRCDCRMRWLVKHRSPLYFKGDCHSPKRIRGQTLEYLNARDLYCLQ